MYWKSQPVLKTSNMELKFESGLWVKTIQSWARISCGAIKCVVDSNQNNTEIPADPQKDEVPQISIKVRCSQIKGKSKTTKEETKENGLI